MSSMTSVNGPPVEARIKHLSGETLNELLDRAVARTPASTALVIRRGMADERWSYRHLAEVVGRVASNLRTEGVGPGDRVITWSQNDPWLVAAYFAVWRLGAILVPLDLRMHTDVAIRIGRRARPAVLLAGHDIDQEVASELGVPILSVDEEGLDPVARRSDPLPSFPAVARGDIAEIVFTSGTTSDPKGVVLTHEQIVHSARAIAQTGMGKRPDRALAIIPLSHMYGQTVPLLMGFISGSTLAFLHSLTPKAIIATMQRERITAVALAPQLLSIILAGIEAAARRSGQEERLQLGRRIAPWLPVPARRLLSRSVLTPLGGALDVVSSGAAMLDEDLQLAWQAFGVRIVEGYGTTECAVICGHTRSRQRVGTVGPPLAGLEVRIAADGELLVRGPNVMSGYWEAPEATAEVLDADGWFHTGDAARIEDHGELVIQGRTRDRISLPNGLNVYPEDVEAALAATDPVRAAVVFEPTPGRIAAALVPVEPMVVDEDLDAAVKAANATLATHQKVGAWRRWPDDDFPRTHTFKVRREPVQRWYVEDSASASAEARPTTSAASTAPALSSGAVTPEAVASLASTLIAEVRGGEPPALTTNAEMASLELDSLAAVTLALRIDEAFDAPLSDDEVLSAHDIGELHSLVLLRQGQAPAAPPSRWAFSRPSRAVRRLLDATITAWAIRVVARPRVEGLEHLEGLDGPVLICPNHTSHLDAPVVRATLPANLRDRVAIAAAADVWFDGSPLGPITELAFGAIPFGRSTDVRASLERVGNLINDGFSVIVFPEGTRSMDGRMGPMREGIGLLATELRAPVIPAHISGTNELLPKGRALPRRRRGSHVVVRFGPAIDSLQGSSSHEATRKVGEAIASLAGSR